jgi:hypothetical protein
MISKFAGKCKTCGQPYRAGEEIYWSREDGGHHQDCRNKVDLFSESEAERLAGELGFIRPGDPIPASWTVRRVPDAH